MRVYVFYSCIVLLFYQNIVSAQPIDKKNIEIIRDHWGVPHIYTKTDAEAAYGLAWVTAEDDFNSMQESLYAGQGLLGKVMGKEGAARDFLAQFMNVKELGAQAWNNASPAFKKYFDGFVQGINDYAAAHPKEVQVKGVFPITVQDALASSIFIFAITSMVHEEVSAIFSNSMNDNSDATAWLYNAFEGTHFGSNAWAITSEMSTDKSTQLVINPHQPMEGPFSWYEAALYSDEGLNIHGACFPGGSSIFVGNTPNLGWAHTFNAVDIVDSYKLEVRGKKNKEYKWGDQWLSLDEQKVKLKVKFGLINIPIKKTTYTSKYGPVLKNKNGYYAVRFPGLLKNRGLEQYYYMNKAQDYDGFMKVLAMQELPRYNIIYADRSDNIYYLFNSLIPKRKPGFDYTKALSTSDTSYVWNNFYTVEELPQVLNPPCNYVFNMNNEPFQSTCTNYCPKPENFPPTMGIVRTETNRSAKFSEVFNTQKKIDFKIQKAIKFDYSLPLSSKYLHSVAPLFTLDSNKYSDLSAEINLLKKWDRNSKYDSKGAAIFYLTCNDLFKRKNYGAMELNNGFEVPKESELITSLRNAKKYLKRHFDKQWVGLGDIVRLYRGDISVPISGLPDVLSPNYPAPYKKGRMTPFVGDSYTQLVAFNKDGSVSLETLLPFGSSTRLDNVHSTDQMPLYSEGKTKQESLDRNWVLKNAERIYHPGE